MAIRAIFFDTSDTLYHSPELKRANEVKVFSELAKAKKLKPDVAEKLYKETKEKLKTRMVHPSRVYVMMELGIERRQTLQWVAEIDQKQHLRKDEKLRTMIDALSLQYDMGIISNVLESSIHNILDALGLDKKGFSHIISADKVEKSKPHDEPFLKALDLSGFRPEECVYVGDSLTKDMIPAKKIGMKTIWVSRDAKESEHVDLFVATIHDVKDAVDKL